MGLFITLEFGVSEVEHHVRYLGLLTVINKSKRITFNNIKNKIEIRLNKLRRNLVSKAGKEMLIK